MNNLFCNKSTFCSYILYYISSFLKYIYCKYFLFFSYSKTIFSQKKCTICCFLINVLNINKLYATLLNFNVLRMCCF